MDNQLITDLITSTERFKLFVLLTPKNEISERVRVLESLGINAIDLGREIIFKILFSDYTLFCH